MADPRSHDPANARLPGIQAKSRKKTMEHPELAKEREFYRYYPQRSTSNEGLSRQPSPVPAHATPTPPRALPSSSGLGIAGAFESHPRPSEDKALTAFAQLGALRLNARRCLISFFDRRNCYILAEATRTSSLCTGQPEFSEDCLSWGNTILPKEESICYYTVNLGGSSPFDSLPTLVVNDLLADHRFKHFPSVVGSAKSRFYAGIPIRSPSGHTIGTYCVLDDKPRDGLTTHQLDFLKDMAGTVMRHLEMTRATEDHRRGKIMVKSLGSFAEGKSGLEDWWQDPWDTPLSAGLSETPLQRQRPAARSNADQEPFIIDRNASTMSSIKSPTNTDTSSIRPMSSVATPASELGPEPPKAPEPVVKFSSTSQNDPQGNIAPEIQAAFSRASNMIVDAIEADGVAFFDAKISTFGGLVDDDLFSEQLPEPDKPCVLLGSALSKNNREVSSPSDFQYSMSESVLRHLLRSYSHGQIFNFDDEISTTPAINSPSANGEMEVSDGFPFNISRKSESTRSLDDENFLRSTFPKAKSLVLYPLWDSHRDRWFASAVIWSSDPMRVFTSEQELSFLAAFSNSVMAEVARLDTKLADAAKADFISSISHELRSPLHGILGMTDLLKDTRIDGQQTNHVETIENCGKTLLETINHVLDFAKINNLTRGKSKKSKKRTQSAKHVISPGQSHTNDIMTLINDVDMSILTEDVVESIFAGHVHKEKSNQTYGLTACKTEALPLTLIIDINQSGNYVFRTQPGAWRRVIMNLFGNALKYTEAGFVKVKLQVMPKSSPTEEYREFRLSVTDSGIGMSEDYKNNRLFHSFAQENPLSQGTGLGLSIVKQIVESLGGEVDVHSVKGQGTKFTVSCPLKESIMSPSFCATRPEQEKGKHLKEVGKRTQGMKVCFKGFEEEEEYFVRSLKGKSAGKLAMKALDGLCADWFGMKTCATGPCAAQPDIIIATESVAKVLRAQHSQGSNKANHPPVIVVCQGAASAQSTTAITIPGVIFECIGQPVGPHKMAKALSSCLDRHAHRLLDQANEAEATLHKVTQLSLRENTPPQSPDIFGRLLDHARPTLTSTGSAPEVRSVHSPPAKKSAYSTPTRSLNCLAVDDNPINLRLLRTFIDKLGHRHVLAVNGLEALDTYKTAQDHLPETGSATQAHTATAKAAAADMTARIDVILMDINMPEMDGLEATRQIRAHEIRNGLPPVTIIALTGVASTETQQEANSSGVNLFLIKPVRLAELEVVLKGVVTGQEKAEQEERDKENQPITESQSQPLSPQQLQPQTPRAPPPQIQLPQMQTPPQAHLEQAHLEQGLPKAKEEKNGSTITVKEVK
ncbi:sensor histidine kinase-like protein/response regulator [Boeremia exigua]|uniref:sensor histidine kinase-like protein/response regulator n=1 Tax=Boeremia exigua TaxID=749465 RepID=UPI001E8CDABB|nr:sensor histidine kinase-like protein/response regulator [Boeremia exigua]KAH6633080.1 sensor histidine kinase-like protein/response regulator [Boeremia exigua]